MLVANKPRWDGSYESRNVSTVRVVKRRTSNQKHRTETNYLVAVTLMIFMGFLYIGLTFQGRAIDEQLYQLQNQVSTLELENQQLNTLTSKYSSFERLEKVATTELGLVKPSADQILSSNH